MSWTYQDILWTANVRGRDQESRKSWDWIWVRIPNSLRKITGSSTFSAKYIIYLHHVLKPTVKVVKSILKKLLSRVTIRRPRVKRRQTIRMRMKRNLRSWSSVWWNSRVSSLQRWGRIRLRNWIGSTEDCWTFLTMWNQVVSFLMTNSRATISWVTVTVGWVTSRSAV